MTLAAPLADQLAFYRAADGIGVLGPRGWSCFGLYGANGSILILAPQKLDGAALLSDKQPLDGPAIQATFSYGGTSGRFAVARAIARIFPSHKAFADRVIAEGIEPAGNFPSGPFPADRMTAHGTGIVEFTTPANQDGLGTMSRLKANADPIAGAAILQGIDDEPDLVMLSVRLPQAQAALAQTIIRQAEHDAAEAGAD